MNTDDIRCRIMEEELGTFWPQWHVVKRLGGGAFGDVFEIFRDKYGIRTYSALKVLRISDREAAFALPPANSEPDNPGGSRSNYGEDDIPEVFLNEIRIMEALHGAPNIVSIENYHFQKVDDTSSLYVRMELLTSFVDVMSVHQRDGTQFTIPEVLQIGKDICTALSYCEQRNIIHRDIKPANLFVDKFGDYKVGDFGASKRMETIHPTHTMTGIGTIMAPEIFAGRSYNNTVDIYALGLVLYQLLNNGRMPFLPADGRYTVQDIDAANYRRLHGEALPPLVGNRVYGDTISARLDSAIRRACDPDSHRRYRTAKEFYDALSGQEAGPYNTEDLSKTVRTQEGAPREQYRGNVPVNSSGQAAPSETEKVYVQKGPVIQKTVGPERKILLFALIPILFAAALIIGIIGLKSKPAYENSDQPVSLGYNHSAAIDKDGSLWTWGGNKHGQLGDGSTIEHHEPVKIMNDVQSVSLNRYYSAAIKQDGSLWMWGYNQHGQLGDGSNLDRFLPVKIMDDVKSVSLGYVHSAAIKKDGSLWLWGFNKYGEVGDGSTETRREPVKIMDGVKSVSLGKYHSAAIKKDGSLWLWGENTYGQLGDGSTEGRHTPVKIMDGVKSVSLCWFHSAAIKTDGSLWLWGTNTSGPLGDGSTVDRYEPVKIMDNVQSVSLGLSHSAAIKTDGSLWLWGYNLYGQLGDGSNQDRYLPVKIKDDIQSVSLGSYHSSAIKTDGSLWLWGFNEYGEVGDGSTETRREPVKIMDGVKQFH